MYLPSHLKSDRAQAATLMRQHPFSSCVGMDENGLPFITALPLEEDSGSSLKEASFTLPGHVARGNPHWRCL